MINVSENWKNNQKQHFVSESYIKITLDVTDPELITSTTTTTDNGHIDYSDTQSIIYTNEREVPKFITLEQNNWLLDSKGTIYSRYKVQEKCYISDILSDSNSLFTNRPILIIGFSRVFKTKIPAINISWSIANNEYPKEFIIRACNGEQIVKEIEVSNNTDVISTIEEEFSNYDRIEIEIIKWCLPNHRARVEQIFLGVRQEFDKNKLTTLSFENETDMIGSVDSINHLKFSTDNIDARYDPDNPSGIGKYLLEQSKITFKYGYKFGDKIEYIPIGVYYLSNWSAPQNGISASFEADNILSLMSKIYARSDFNGEPINLYDLALKVLYDANLPLNDDGTRKWVVDTRLQEFYTSAPLPLKTHLECLQLIAQASCSALYVDRNGQIRLEIIDENNLETDYSINDFTMYQLPNVSLQKPLKQVLVNIYNYAFEDVERVLYSNTYELEPNREKIIGYNYSGIATSINATPNVEVTPYTHAFGSVADIETPTNINLTISGYQLKQTLADTITIVDYEVENSTEEQTVDNPLITNATLAQNVGRWVMRWLKQRKNVEIKFRVDPRLNALDVVEVVNKYGVKNKVRVTSVSITSNGALQGTLKGRVIE